MNYIITGAEGMIGTFLKRRLDQEHTCVMEVDRRKGFDILSLDATRLNPQTQRTDILYHLAAHCRINEGVEHPELPHRNNADGTFQVMEFCRKNGINKVVNFSSSRVLSPEENPYTASKKYGEHLVQAYHDCFGIDFITVRPSTVYGPIHDVTSRLMTDWCQAALQNGELPIYGDETKTLDFTHVNDFVDGVMLLTNSWEQAKNRTYNISGGEEVRLVDLANMIIYHAKGGRIKFFPQPTKHTQHIKINISDMRRLGYEPKIKLRDGVEEMVDFYRRRNDGK